MKCPNCESAALPEGAHYCLMCGKPIRSASQIDYSDLIAERTKDFTGREWVFHKINAWLEHDESRVFLLTGGPGSGKSALAARLVQISRGEVAAEAWPHLGKGRLTFAHFCQAQNDRTINPLRFIEALSRQLADCHQDFAKALLQINDRQITINATQTIGTAARGAEIKNVVIESLHLGNLSARHAFDQVIRRPLDQLFETDFKETILILVDALDEALTYDSDNSDNNMVTLLEHATDHPQDLPGQVRFLFTSRPDPRITQTIGKASLNLIDDAPDSVNDVRVYAYRRLNALPEPQRGELAGRVEASGKGNFLYARYVLDNLLTNINQVKDLAGLILPSGLDDIYRQFIKRELGRNLEQWGERYRSLLGVIAVTHGEGLTLAQLAGVTKLSQLKTKDILRVCAQYLYGPQPDGPFRIYHQSFRDFLLIDQEYQTDPAEASAAIAHFFIEEYNGGWLTCQDDYALRYTPAHLVEALQQTHLRHARRKLMHDLIGVVTNIQFMRAKAKWFGSSAVEADLSAAHNLQPDWLAKLRLMRQELFLGLSLALRSEFIGKPESKQLRKAWRKALANHQETSPFGIIVEERQVMVEVSPEVVYRAFANLDLTRQNFNWKVEVDDPGCLVRFVSEYATGGRVRLQFELTPQEGGKTLLRQTTFYATGKVFRLLYLCLPWLGFVHLRRMTFPKLLSDIAGRVEFAGSIRQDVAGIRSYLKDVGFLFLGYLVVFLFTVPAPILSWKWNSKTEFIVIAAWWLLLMVFCIIFSYEAWRAEREVGWVLPGTGCLTTIFYMSFGTLIAVELYGLLRWLSLI